MSVNNSDPHLSNGHWTEHLSGEHEFTSFVDVLRFRATHQPDSRAFIFLSNGEDEAGCLTYQQLDENARVIGSHLQTLGLSGQRILLHFPMGLDFVSALFGCFYAGAVAVPTFPPTKRNDKLLRLQHIAEDCQAAAIVTLSSAYQNMEEDFACNPILSRLQCILSDALNPGAQIWVNPQVNLHTLGILQYTSGSTGTPKGVMLNQGNLLHNQRVIKQAFEHTSKSVGVSWLPLFHDMGLIGNILQVVYLGIQVTLMAPEAFVQKPLRWLQAITRYRATTSGGPDFAYDLCVRKITPEQIATLDLSSWQVAYTGAEPVLRQTLERFAKAFAPCGFKYEAFHPCYGMAEATLMVSGGRQKMPPVIREFDAEALERNTLVDPAPGVDCRSVVGCGHAHLGQTIQIVDPESSTLCPADQIGEIWVSGESIGLGYWNKPELTERDFNAKLAPGQTGKFLRTGDLGFLHQGDLFVTGRLKDLIIIRGRNHYPQEIERTVRESSHQSLRHCYGAAFSTEIEGEERLVIVHEVDRSHLRNLDTERVATEVCRAVSQYHGLQVAAICLLRPMKLPRTSSGKIRRRACRQAFIARELETISNWGEMPKSRTPVATKETGDTPCNSNSKSAADNLIQWLRDYAPQRINSRLMDERRCIPPYIVLDMGNHGLLGMQVPENYGGLALTYQDSLNVFVQLAGIDLTLASFVGVNHILGTRPIVNSASQAIKDEILPAIASGRELASFAITEPGAGSNPRGIAATATPLANGNWQLRGQKIWIGSASWSGVMNVFVQQHNAQGQPTGISGFVLRQGVKGLRQGPEALTLGMRAMVQNAVFLEDVEVSPASLLGPEGGGLNVAMDAMMHGRFGLGAISLGGMKRCAQLMLRYAQRRSVSTGLLLDNPLTLVRMNSLIAGISVLESLLTKMAGQLDNGSSPPEEAFIVCKVVGPEMLWQAADHLVQLLGGRGYIETNYAPQILRDARLLRIFEGPTETLNMYLGSRVIHHGEGVTQFLSNDLQCPSVAQRLKTVAAQIAERCQGHHKPFADLATSTRWASILVGELTAKAFLYAVAQHALQSAVTPQLIRVEEWSRIEFEQCINQALSISAGESVAASRDETADWISGYQDAIGDLEQTLPGNDDSVDIYLRKSDSSGAVNPDISAHTSPTDHTLGTKNVSQKDEPGQVKLSVQASAKISAALNERQHISVESVQDWLVAWLAAQVKKPPASIDVTQSFFDFGLDSVIAVSLVQELEEWLKWPSKLDATLVWSFPTIEAMSLHLVAEANISNKSASPASDSVITKDSTNNADGLLDNVDSADKVEAVAKTAESPGSTHALEACIADEIASIENILRRY